MKVEVTVGFYSGDDLVNTVSYVLDSGNLDSVRLASIFATLPECSDDIYFSIEGVKELYE